MLSPHYREYPMTYLSSTAGGTEFYQLRRLKIASIFEATTLVLLVFVAVPLKHIYGMPMGSTLLGPIHGIAFLIYIWMIVETVSGGGWRAREVARLVVVAFIPLAGYLNTGWLQEKAKVARTAEQTQW